MGRRTHCHWRSYVLGGDKLWSLEDFSIGECTLISPSQSRMEYTGRALPYFQVHSDLRRHIWESMHLMEVPPNATMRHRCMEMVGRDSRGLCINPLHLCLGSKDDNRMDARVEWAMREGRGYWKPPHYQPLEELPTTLKWDTMVHTERDTRNLWLLTVRHEVLRRSEVENHHYCREYARLMGPSMTDRDRRLIGLASKLLDYLLENCNYGVLESVDILQRELGAYRSSKVRGKCRNHFLSAIDHQMDRRSITCVGQSGRSLYSSDALM